MALESQFYDQLAQRLNRQDESLTRIEESQTALLSCMQTTKTAQAEHISEDASNFMWIKWILGGVWLSIAAIVTYLVRG
jgi:hypothetical protein